MRNSKILSLYIDHIMRYEKINDQNKNERANVMLDYDKFLQQHYAELNYSKTKIMHINHYFGTQNHLKASSYNRKITYMRKFYDWLLLNKFHQKNLSSHLRFKKLPQKLPQSITLQQIMQLCEPKPDELDLLQNNEISIRDQLILEFLFSTGVRNCELRNICLQDLNEELTNCVIFTQKGGNLRTVYIGSYARKWLESYLKIRQIDIKNLSQQQKREPLFCNLEGKSLYTQQLTLCVRKLAIKRLGFAVKPHQIRHTFATIMLRSTGCLSSVQKMLGHKKITSTEVYCDLELKDKEKTLEVFHPRKKMKVLKSVN